MARRTLLVTRGNAEPAIERLPYEDQWLSITEELTSITIEVKPENTDVSVQATACTTTLRISENRYEAGLRTDDIVLLRTGNGNDRVRVEADDGARVVIDTQHGDDDVVVHATPTAQGREGGVVIDAGPGNDRIEVNGVNEAHIYGGSGDDVIRSTAPLGMISTGDGADSLNIGDGNVIIDAMSGTNALAGSLTDHRIYTSPQNVTFSDRQGVPPVIHANNAPLAGDYATTFKILGDQHYNDQITRLLNMLKASRTASLLMDDLVARHARIEIETTVALGNAGAEALTRGKDPEVRDGRRGDAVLECKIYFNPLINRRQQPAVVALYHELCHAWNFATGTSLGDGEQQVIGLDSGMSFDFDDDPSTPPSTSNPDPFNENALRQELGLPPRLEY